MSYSPKGVAITKFSLACDQGIGKNKSTLWLNCIIFGRVGDDGLAGRMQEWLYKGALIFAQGTLQVREYTDKQGVERKSVETILSMVEILSARSEKPAEEEVVEGPLDDLDEPF